MHFRKSFLTFFNVLFCVSTLALNAQTPQKTVIDSYGPENKYFGDVIILYSDGTFFAGPTGETGGQEQTGIYSRIGNSIRFSHILHVGDYTVIDERSPVWRIEPVDNSVYSTERIASSDGKTFYNKDKIPTFGLARVIGNVDVVTSGFQTFVTSAEVRVRSGPGVNFKYYRISFMDIKTQTKDVLPKNYKVKAIGRSKTKQEIDGISDYWYFCGGLMTWYDEGPVVGWIFGGYLRQDEN